MKPKDTIAVVHPALGSQVDVLQAADLDGEAKASEVDVELMGDGVVGSGCDGGQCCRFCSSDMVVNGVELDVVAGEGGDVQVVQLQHLHEGKLEALEPPGPGQHLGTDSLPCAEMSLWPHQGTKILGLERHLDLSQMRGTP